MKIHIIGGPGSGKTTLAKRLSEQYHILRYDLDELMWDNRSGAYGTKRDPAERAALLDDILKQHSWIIEGVYYEWCRQCFSDADRIYLLELPRRTYRRRIIRRFLRRKFGMEAGKKESFKSLRALLKWADKYRTVNLVEIKKLLSGYQAKIAEERRPGA